MTGETKRNKTKRIARGRRGKRRGGNRGIGEGVPGVI